VPSNEREIDMFAQNMLRGAVVAEAVVLELRSTAAFARQELCIDNSATITSPAAFCGQAIRMGAEIAGEGRR
jgi:hypothetical protein